MTVSPDGEQPRPGAGPRYTVAAVARRLGVAPATLRTWDRRYGLGPSDHAFGQHRRYTRADVARLVRMRRLVLDGVAPADAARAAHAGDELPGWPGEPATGAVVGPAARTARSQPHAVGPDAGAGGDPERPDRGRPDRGRPDRERPDPDRAGPDGAQWAAPDGAEPDGAAPDGAEPDGAEPDGAAPDGAEPDGADPVAGRPGGGRVLRIPGAGPRVRGLARAALMLDTATMTATVRAAVRAEGTARAWHGLLVPVLTAIGERWAATGAGVEVEHLLCDSVLVGFREARLAAETTGEDRVLLACAPGDYHSLPLLVVAAALAERGIGCRVAGPAVPPEALAAAVRRVRPLSLFCWSSMPSTGDPGHLDAVPALSPAVSVVVGGPGWRVGRLGPKVDVAVDVPTAVAAIAAPLGR